MKILHLANHIGQVGNGIVNVMIDLACKQAQGGHEVVVASGGGGFEPLLKQFGVRHTLLPQSKNPLRMPAMFAGYWKLASEFSPDIVHAHMMTGAMLARMSARRYRYSLVTTVHNEFQRTASLMRVGDCVVAVSDAVFDAMAKRGVPATRMKVVKNGTIGSPRMSGRGAPTPVQLAPKAIVTVAGMYSRKGIFDLARAFALVKKSVPDAELYFVGEGPEREACKQLADELGIGKDVHFTGFISDPRPYLLACSVFVLASHADPCPLVISEAREAGCAIIGTQVGGIPESLDNGSAGVLVPPANPERLAQALIEMLNGTAERESWRRRAKDNLGWLTVDRVNHEYLDIYQKLVTASAA